MSHTIKRIPRGTTAKCNLYAGPAGELVMDTQTDEIVLQNGTVGGVRMASKVSVTNLDTRVTAIEQGGGGGGGEGAIGGLSYLPYELYGDNYLPANGSVVKIADYPEYAATQHNWPEVSKFVSASTIVSVPSASLYPSYYYNLVDNIFIVRVNATESGSAVYKLVYSKGLNTFITTAAIPSQINSAAVPVYFDNDGNLVMYHPSTNGRLYFCTVSDTTVTLKATSDLYSSANYSISQIRRHDDYIVACITTTASSAQSPTASRFLGLQFTISTGTLSVFSSTYADLGITAYSLGQRFITGIHVIGQRLYTLFERWLNASWNNGGIHFMYSDDNGATWNIAKSGTTARLFPSPCLGLNGSMAVSVQSMNLEYARTADMFPSFTPGIEGLRYEPVNGRIYIVGNNKICYSMNSGTSWNEYSSAPPLVGHISVVQGQMYLGAYYENNKYHLLFGLRDYSVSGVQNDAVADYTHSSGATLTTFKYYDFYGYNMASETGGYGLVARPSWGIIYNANQALFAVADDGTFCRITDSGSGSSTYYCATHGFIYGGSASALSSSHSNELPTTLGVWRPAIISASPSKQIVVKDEIGFRGLNLDFPKSPLIPATGAGQYFFIYIDGALYKRPFLGYDRTTECRLPYAPVLDYPTNLSTSTIAQNNYYLLFDGGGFSMPAYYAVRVK